MDVSLAWAQKPTSSPAPAPTQAAPESAKPPNTKSTCPIQSAMKEGLLATQHRVMIKCWHVFEGNADLSTAHPLSRERLASRRGSPACASQGAKLAALQAVGSMGMRGLTAFPGPRRVDAERA